MFYTFILFRCPSKILEAVINEYTAKTGIRPIREKGMRKPT
jgi:hypothetical protein